jgi:fatty acid desaturase
MSANRRFFRCTAWDALPAFCGIAQVAFLLWTLLAFPSLPLWAIVLSFVVVAMAYCWNLQCISHNFIHNPYFTSNWLNRAFGVMESIAIGMPHLLYHHYHLNHHAGDNDVPGPDGTTRDWSSTYRYGKDGKAEAFWRYCLFSFFRVEVGPVVRVAFKHGREHIVQVIVETIALAAFWVAVACVDWRYFLLFYLPSFFLGWVISYAEGYLEHDGAQPGNPYANSVSSYNWLYNLLWFNNGYHQEHHWDPKCHWTRIKELHSELRPQLEANDTRILRGPHLTAHIEALLIPKRPAADPPQQDRTAA